MGARAKQHVAGVIAIVVTISVVAVATRATSSVDAGAQTAAPHRFRLTAAMDARFAPKPVGATRAKGAFAATLDTRCMNGWCLDVPARQLRLSALTSRVTAIHIHAGGPRGGGRVVVSLCDPCRALPASPGDALATYGGWSWQPSGWKLGPILSGPTYVDVHTMRNPRGEIRGPIDVMPLGGST